MIKSVTVSVGRTIDLGKFEFLRVDGSATAELAEGDTLETIEREALAEARKLMLAAYDANHPARIKARKAAAETKK